MYMVCVKMYLYLGTFYCIGTYIGIYIYISCHFFNLFHIHSASQDVYSFVVLLVYFCHDMLQYRITDQFGGINPEIFAATQNT